jgi:hypothetical protein
MNLGNWAEWAGAILTAGGIALALSIQLLIPWWRRPKLEIEPGARPQPVTDIDNDKQEGQWWDMPVRNNGRGETASAAQVMLTGVRRQEESTGNGDALRETRVPLRSFKWTHLEDAQAEIPAGVERSVELGKIKPKGQPGRPLTLGIFPRLENSQRADLPDGRYLLEFAVVAKNARARYYSLEVAIDVGKAEFPAGVAPR